MGKTYISSYNELDCLRGIAHKLGGNAASANELGALRTIVTQLDAAPGNRTVGNMNEVDCLRAIVRHYAAAGPSFDADVSDWADVRVPAAGGAVSAATKDTVNAFTLAAKTKGYWPKLNRVSIFGTNGFTGLNVPLKVGLGAATDTFVNFVAGDYSLATGLTGNGTTKYLNTGLLANALTNNDTHAAIYDRSLVSVTCAAGERASLRMIVFGSQIFSDQYDSANGRVATAGLTGAMGFACTSRTASNSHVIYRNGVSVANNATSGGALTAISMYVFAENNAGVAASLSAASLGAYSFGSGLTAADAANYNTDMEALQDALGRGVQ